MKSNNSFSTGHGSITVELLDDRVVVCKVVGKATGPLIAESMRQTKIAAQQALEKGNQPSLYLDAAGITSQDSAARNHAKHLAEYNFARIAVYSRNRAITSIGKYIARMGGMGDYTRFYRSPQEAKRWAWDAYEKKIDVLRRRQLVGTIGLAIVSLIVLAGWQFDIVAFRSLTPSLRPVNPMVAVTFFVIAIGLAAHTKDWHRNVIQAGCIAFSAIWSMLFGLLVLARIFLSVDTPIDTFLFVDKMQNTAMGGRASISAAVALVFIGIMITLLYTRQAQRWQRDIYFAFSGIIFLITLGTVFAYCFGYGTLDGANQLLPMALGAALGCIFANYALSGMGQQTPATQKGNRVIASYWQAMIVVILLVMATGIVWQQTVRDVRQSVNAAAKESFMKVENTINTRLDAYANSLVGVRGLFAASTDVSPTDFAEYFKTIDLAASYPGFSAITYSAVVPEDQKQEFTTATRARAIAGFEKLSSFTIFPETTDSLHYPITYVQPSSATTVYGYDLHTEEIRRTTLEKARDENAPASSGMINLNASRGAGAPVNNGFFLAEPIYRSGFNATGASVEERRSAIMGFALAYFQNDRLFNSALAFAKDDDVQYQLTYLETGQQLYGTEAKNVQASAPIVQSAELSIAGQKWRLDMKLAPNFGKDRIFDRLPNTVIFIGLLLSALAGLLVFTQLRRRDQAFALAEQMTEDLKNERNLAIENQQKDEAILSSIGDAVFAIDTKERITLFNPVCERISGWTAAEAMGMHYKSVLKFILAEGEKLNDTFIKKALSGQLASMKNHTLLIRRDGQKVAVADSAAPIHNAKGGLIGAIVVFRDVTKEYELDRAKTEFVSLASHQLRTPLSAINWYVEMLMSGDSGELNKDQKIYVQEVFEGNQRMIELVNSLLDVSRLDLGKLTNKPEPTDLAEVVVSIQKELQSAIAAKGLQYKVHAQRIPQVLGDPKLLRIIVQNLSSNAVKYTNEKGKVTITLRRATAEDLAVSRIRKHDDYLYLGVADTGLGIPKEQQSHIFSKLFRADNVRVLDVEGNGLGLYLVKQVVEKLGGKIWFTSVEGKGTTFNVVLPFKTKHNK